jgi:hypothetical protein
VRYLFALGAQRIGKLASTGLSLWELWGWALASLDFLFRVSGLWPPILFDRFDGFSCEPRLAPRRLDGRYEATSILAPQHISGNSEFPSRRWKTEVFFLGHCLGFPW